MNVIRQWLKKRSCNENYTKPWGLWSTLILSLAIVVIYLGSQIIAIIAIYIVGDYDSLGVNILSALEANDTLWVALALIGASGISTAALV